MARTLSLVWGLVLLLVGAALLAWVGYNTFVETLPAAEGRNPLFPAAFGAVVLGLGVQRVRRALRASGGR